MHNHFAPSNTSDVVTRLGTSQHVSCHMTHKVTALKHDTEIGIERAAFDPMITPKGLSCHPELLQEAA